MYERVVNKEYSINDNNLFQLNQQNRNKRNCFLVVFKIIEKK